VPPSRLVLEGDTIWLLIYEAKMMELAEELASSCPPYQGGASLSMRGQRKMVGSPGVAPGCVDL
jgi:hypothetical protein